MRLRGSPLELQGPGAHIERMEGVRVTLEQRGEELVAAVSPQAAADAGLHAGVTVSIAPVSETRGQRMDRWLKEMAGREPPPLEWDEFEPPRGSEAW